MPQGVAKQDFMAIAKLISKLKLRRTVNYSYHLIQRKYVYTADGSFINEGTSKLNFVTEEEWKNLFEGERI